MPSRTLLKVVPVLVLALVLGWLGYDAWLGGVPVEAASAGTGPIREFVDEQAQTRLAQTYLLTMPMDGRILPMELEEGAVVKKGQTVAQIVPADLDTQVAEARAAVERLDASIKENDDTTVEDSIHQQTLQYVQSMQRTVEAAAEQVKAGEAKVAFANKTLDRWRETNKALKGAAAEEELHRLELNQVEAQVQYQQYLLFQRATEALYGATAMTPTIVKQYTQRKTLRAAVLDKERAEAAARLDQVLRNRARGTLTSPVDGVVLRRPISNERPLPAGTVLLEIGKLDMLEVEADILSQDVGNLAVGQPVDVYGPAIGKRDARGTVRLIYPAGFTKLSSLGVEQQRVKVVVSFYSEDLARLRAEQHLGLGYRVRVRVYTADKPQALVIPRSALFRGAAGDWRTFVIRAGRASLQPIQVGLMNDDLVEVSAGLAEGDAVILAPETHLTDGARVRPVVQATPRENGKAGGR